MEMGMIGLGRMGANMTQRLVRNGHRVVGFDPKPEARKEIENNGAESANSLAALIDKLKTPRVVWMMVPAGKITDDTVNALIPLLSPGDAVIDGGNSNYKDTLRRAALTGDKQIHYVDSDFLEYFEGSDSGFDRTTLDEVPEKDCGTIGPSELGQ